MPLARIRVFRVTLNPTTLKTLEPENLRTHLGSMPLARVRVLAWLGWPLPRRERPEAGGSAGAVRPARVRASHDACGILGAQGSIPLGLGLVTNLQALKTQMRVSHDACG